MRKVCLLIQNPTLRRICTAELEAIGAEACVLSEQDVSTDAIPSSASLLLIDLDAHSIPVSTRALPVVGISSAEHTLESTVSGACRSILHRPFPLEQFRSVILPLLSAAPTASRYSVRRKRRRTDPAEALSPAVLLSGDILHILRREIPLTPSEATVFRALLDADGAPVARTSLASLLGKAAEGNLPDVHICAIRKKLAAYGLDACIQTVRGKGYRLFTDLPAHETERNRKNDE